MGKRRNQKAAHPTPTGRPRNPKPTITKSQRQKRKSQRHLLRRCARDFIPTAAFPHVRASPLTAGPIVPPADILSAITTTASTALNRRGDVHAIKLYCATLSTRKPIYSIRGSSNVGYTCTLTLPQKAQCPVVIAYRKEKRLARDGAAHAACRILKRNHQISPTNQLLRSPYQKQTCYFGHKIISAAESEHLGLQSIDLDVLRYTLDSGVQGDIARRLKHVGNAFLKVFISAYVFARFQDDLEGALTTRFHNEVHYDTLQGYVISSGIARNIRVDQGPTPRTAGTIFRKLMGAAVWCGGVDNAVRAARSLGLAFDASTTTIKGIWVVYKLYMPIKSTLILSKESARIDTDALNRIQRVQAALGYVFTDRQLALEAITHTSAKKRHSYERLEFLGDAVLEFVVCDHYCKCSSTMTAAHYNKFKVLLLSNDALGCFLVSVGLSDILIASRTINTKLRRDATRVAEMRKAGQANWLGMKLNKVLADAMEAIIGAMFVDCKFELEPVHEILSRTLIPFIEGGGMVFSR